MKGPHAMPLAPAPALPCTTRPNIYDVLLDAEPDTSAYKAAHAEAVSLCSTCTRSCGERVTLSSAPRGVEDFDDTEWIPAPKPVVLLPVGPARQPRVYFPPTGREYVRPERRPAVWARMAAELAAEGRPLTGIALALCVSEETAAQLLAAPTNIAA